MSLLVFTTTYESGNSRMLDVLLRVLRVPCTLVLRIPRLDIPPPAHVRVVPLHEGPRHVSFPAEVVRLARLIDELRPSVVLSMLTGPNIIAVLARSLARHKPRLVLNEQTQIPEDLRRLRPPARHLTNLLVRALYPRADAVVPVSRSLARSLARTYGIPPRLLHMIHNPIRIASVRRQALAGLRHPWLRDRIPIVAAVGRLSIEKGHGVLLEALARVRGARRVRLWLIGDGPERVRLEALAARLGLGSDVQFLGFQKNPYAYVARATLLAHPSRWEGFGIAIPEALALGVPVISTSCPGGPSEILRRGRDGMIVPPDNPARLSRAIAMLLGDAALRKRYAARGRRRAAAFDAARIVDQYVTILGVRRPGRTARIPSGA